MIRCLALAAVAAASIAAAQPVTTAFTFQGNLADSGLPASGLYDFKFLLLDAPSGGTQQGPQLCSLNVPVTNGGFTVQLDFGPQFTGQQRFLEVWARLDTGLSCATNSGFTILAPRLPMTASPNAVFALTAAAASNATNAAQLNCQPAAFYSNAANLTGTLSPATLSGTYPNALTLSSNGNIFSGNGAGLFGLNAANVTAGCSPASASPATSRASQGPTQPRCRRGNPFIGVHGRPGPRSVFSCPRALEK
jgi:hypothetical protein